MPSKYVELSYKLYSLLVRMKSLLEVRGECAGMSAWTNQIDEQIRHIESHKFRVAVVGEFKRGKSSLINALLERDVLPADVLPTTATFNRVTYGDVPLAYLTLKDGSRIDIPIDSLAGHITKLTEASSENARRIEEAVVAFPSMFCKNDVEIIDTPGLNDDEEMTRLTVSHLQDVDLAIIAVSATMPFSDTEADLTVRLLETDSVCRVLFAVTMIDRVDEEDRERLLNSVRARIKEKVLRRLRESHGEDDPAFRKYEACVAEPMVYALSAKDAARARSLQDAELFEASGYLRFMRELPDILMTSQATDMTLNAVNVYSGILRSARAWTGQRLDALKSLKDAVLTEKHQVAEGMYRFALEDEKRAWMASAEGLLNGLQGEAASLCEPYANAWRAAGDGDAERMAALMDAMSAVYLNACDSVQRATGERLQQALDAVCDAAVTPMMRQSAARLEAYPGLRDEIARRWQAVVRPPRLDAMAESKDRRVPYHWSVSPIPVKYPCAGDEPLRVATDAVKESLRRCARENLPQVRQRIEALHAAHLQQIQSFVMGVFRLCAEHAAQAEREIEALGGIDMAQLDQLEREIEALQPQTAAVPG